MLRKNQYNRNKFINMMMIDYNYFYYSVTFLKVMNSTSFQTTHYNHAHQVKIQGQSNLKIFDG